MKAKNVDKILTYLATYGPAFLFVQITTRCTSLNDVWKEMNKWAGVRPSSSKLLTYYYLKQSYDPASDMSAQDFYYALRDAMESSLFSAGSGVLFNGTVLPADEDLSPISEAQVIMDWLHVIGGNPLVETVFRQYSRET